MIADFLEYERKLGHTGVLPRLQALGVDLGGKAVLDAGCGYGGVLLALSEKFSLAKALGLDLDAEMIETGRKRCPATIRLERGDFFTVAEKGWDLIVMRDVLEHILDVEGALARAASLLAPGGSVYATFAPFYGPFGGHQHNGAGWAANMPWIHWLPEGMLRRLLRFPGNSYKGAEALAADMDTVLKTRLTWARFRRAARAAGLKPVFEAGFAVRPDYRLKFGLPALRFPGVPVAEEIFCTGAEAVLARV